MEQHLKLHVLASGSKGNAAIVENAATGCGVLVDCGICKRDFFSSCDQVGFDPTRLQAVLVTHEHTDHTKGLGVVLRGLRKAGVRPQLLTSMAVRRASSAILEALEQELCDFSPFEADDALGLAGMEVVPFATSHDSAQSFGFRFERNGDAVGYAADTGVVTGAAHEALSGCRIVGLEANHDLDMLEAGPYPLALKRRVASDLGHLSNEQAADELELLLHDGLETVVALHISQNNNTYRLPRETLEEVVERAGASTRVLCAFQQRTISA